MEKLIIVGPKEEINHMDYIKNLIASQAINVLIIDPKEQPDYEEIIKNAGDKFITLNNQKPENFRKEIEKFNKVLELKPQTILDTKSLIDETPWYNKFIKKWDKYDHQSSKPNSKKKWNKRK